jgi:hypothetical protein
MEQRAARQCLIHHRRFTSRRRAAIERAWSVISPLYLARRKRLLTTRPHSVWYALHRSSLDGTRYRTQLIGLDREPVFDHRCQEGL